jgi:hypothetical protein
MRGSQASIQADLKTGTVFRKNEFNDVILCNAVFINVSAISTFLITHSLSCLNTKTDLNRIEKSPDDIHS